MRNIPLLLVFVLRSQEASSSIQVPSDTAISTRPATAAATGIDNSIRHQCAIWSSITLHYIEFKVKICRSTSDTLQTLLTNNLETMETTTRKKCDFSSDLKVFREFDNDVTSAGKLFHVPRRSDGKRSVADSGQPKQCSCELYRLWAYQYHENCV